MQFLLKTLLLSGYTLATLVLGAAIVITATFLYLSPNLPAVSQLLDVQLQTPLRVYSADNKLLGEFGEKRRIPILYKDVPTSFINAILAAEDDRFYQHFGVDPKGLLRATSELIATGHIKTGGSTITMQVAKNFFLSSERTFARKINEIFLALQIERELSKSQILELYVNKIYLGKRAYGVAAAAQVYYGTSIDRLSLAQLAMIAGLPKAPSKFNPLVKPARALLRRNWILGRMLHLGMIDHDEYKLAINETITAQHFGLHIELDAPYIAEMTRLEMLRRYGNSAYTSGFVVYTTINSDLQKRAQQAVVDGLTAYDLRHGYRGPEQRIEVHEKTPLEDASPKNASLESPATEDTLFITKTQQTLWQETLKSKSTMGGMTAAIVTKVEEQSFSALLAVSNIVEVGWEHGISKARAFITNNKLGPKPKTASDIVAVGDLLRIKRDANGNWHLSQIPKVQGALVALDSKDGSILALTGGFDFGQSKFNRITQAHRQPGSNFKPMIYSAALEHGFTAASLINDAPLVVSDSSLESVWRPSNDGGKFYGPTRLRKALYKSRNLVSIRLLKQLGIKNAVDYISQFGFDKESLPHDLSLALGSHAIPPIKLVSVYASFANGGYKIEPYLISQIYDHKNTLIYEAKPPTVCKDCESTQAINTAVNTGMPGQQSTRIEPSSIEEILARQKEKSKPIATRIIDKRVAYIMDSILKDVIKKGTGRRALTLNRADIAGKTGTTNGPTDAWFSGYGDDIAVTTWVGFDQNQTLGRREYGGSAALPIWIDFMRLALKNRPVKEKQLPEGVVSVLIDPKSGKKAMPGQKNAIFEYMLSEHIPSISRGTSQAAVETEYLAAPEEIF